LKPFIGPDAVIKTLTHQVTASETTKTSQKRVFGIENLSTIGSSLYIWYVLNIYTYTYSVTLIFLMAKI